MTNLHPLEQHLKNSLALLAPTGRLFYVAYSGGEDSTALLHAAHKLLSASPEKRLCAWHINHGLAPEASEWEARCRALCAQLSVPLEVSSVGPAQRAKQSEEMFARNARYAIWRDQLPSAAFLLQAHHLEDQAETLLLQLMRGRPQGMPVMRLLASRQAKDRSDAPKLLRPFLNLPKASIRDYLAAKSLRYITDPSNRKLQHDRGYIRHRVLPLLHKRWPGAAANLALAADQLETYQDVARAYHQQLLQQHLSDGRLHLDSVRALPQMRLEALIVAWLTHLRLPLPPRGLLTQLQRQLNAKQDATPVMDWEGGSIRRYRNHLYALPPLPALDPSWRLSLRPKPASSYALPLGELRINERTNRGMRQDATPIVIGYSILYTSEKQNGLKLRLAGRGGQRSLKKFLQESGIPPWLRPYTPIIYSNEEIAAVANIGVTQAFVCAQGAGMEFTWRAPAYGLLPSQA